jgi:triacylglycerol esterase/lipase EstA (alpha/beta hydrolase family)
VELRGKYGFNKMCLAAHSIGGLVTRSLLNKYKFDKDDDFIKLYVTFATPWSGFAAADASQKLQHKSLPSWGDIGEQSVFVRRTLNAKLPQNVKYYLFYGKEDKVSEGRALDDRALLDAKESFGFDCGHSSILSDRDVFRRFSYILESEFYPHGKSRKIKR